MPSRTRMLHTNLWTSKYFWRLEVLEKLVYLFLMFGEPTSETSVFPLSIPIYAAQLKMSEKDLREVIRNLESNNLVVYDEIEEEILVTRYFDHRSPNGGITYEMFRNDLADIHSKNLLLCLTGLAKKYEIPAPFYAALADIFPELEDESVMKEYRIRWGKTLTLAEARNAASKGRGKAAAAT